MITREQIKGAYSEGEALALYNEVKSTGDFVGFCQRFMHDEDYQVARNTFWALTKASHEELAPLQTIRNEIIDLAIATENSSVRRLSLNVVERLEMNEEDLRTDFLDFCIEHAVAVDELPGIQSVSMKLAYRMCSFYPELMEELKRTIKNMDIEFYRPAVKCVREKILSGKMK